MTWARLTREAVCPDCGRTLLVKVDGHFPGHADHASASTTPNRRRGRDCTGSRLPVADEHWKVPQP